MSKTYIVTSGTDSSVVIGKTDSLEQAIFIRGELDGEHFNPTIYKKINVEVTES